MVVPRDTVEQVIQTCLAAARRNREADCRRGNIVVLSPQDADDVVIAADLHGNRLNFQKLLRIVDLEGHPRRHLVAQEVCHGGPCYPGERGCMSHLLLEDVAQLKVRYPQRFHFLLSNHELAELTDYPIAKLGRMLNLHFRSGVYQLYGSATAAVRAAYVEFLASCPLAVRLTNGVFICHGIPGRVDQAGFDCSVFDRPLQPADLERGGAVFDLVWGRDFRAENGAAFASAVGAEVTIHGHEPCAGGYAIPSNRQVILDSCGSNACYAILPLGRPLSHPDVVRCIHRLHATPEGGDGDARSRAPCP